MDMHRVIKFPSNSFAMIIVILISIAKKGEKEQLFLSS